MAHVWNITDGNIYVSKNGNDTTGDGSMANPYASLEKARLTILDGQKMVLGTGEWKETVGGWKNITLEGDGDVILNGSGPTYFRISYGSGTSPVLIFKNIKFIGYYSSEAIYNDALSSSASIKFYNCFIQYKALNVYRDYGVRWLYFYNTVLISTIMQGICAAKYAESTNFITPVTNAVFNGVFKKVNCILMNVYEGGFLESTNCLYLGCTILYQAVVYPTQTAWSNGYGSIKSIIINPIFIEPQFNNPAIGDYTLQPTSPCLFAGKNNATIGAFGLGYSYNPNSSVFTKEGGATFSASSGTDDIVRASQTINGIATYMFNLNAGKTSGTVESAWIDLQAIRYLLTTRLFANLIYNASGVATSRPDNVETAGEKAVYYDFEFKYCLTEAEKAAAAWKAVIWNKAVTIDNSGRGNADAAFVASEAKYISARFVKIKLYMREG